MLIRLKSIHLSLRRPERPIEETSKAKGVFKRETTRGNHRQEHRGNRGNNQKGREEG